MLECVPALCVDAFQSQPHVLSGIYYYYATPCIPRQFQPSSSFPVTRFHCAGTVAHTCTVSLRRDVDTRRRRCVFFVSLLVLLDNRAAGAQKRDDGDDDDGEEGGN